MNVLLFLFIGLLAGALAERSSRSSMGRPTGLALGVVGALLGGFLFGLPGLALRGLFGSLVAAAVGAALLLLLVGFFHRKT